MNYFNLGFGINLAQQNFANGTGPAHVLGGLAQGDQQLPQLNQPVGVALTKNFNDLLRIPEPGDGPLGKN
jgi:hypothetical protein